MGRIKIRDHAGGINQRVDAARVTAGSEYYLLMNGRTRQNVIRPIRKPRNLTAGLPVSGILQGAYAVNDIQVVFVNGKAYYKSFDPEGAVWNEIANLQMSTTAERIYMELVPASSDNYIRASSDATNIKAPVKLTGTVAGSRQCGVVCDGINQPWAIFPDASARVLGTYAQWTLENREYVPIGKLPMRHGNTLYMVGNDGNGSWNQIFRSVSGRFLDFVIAVNEDGDKTSPLEREGGAPALAYHFDFGDVTALNRIPSSDEAFFSSTIKNSFLIIPDFQDLVYGEPTLSNQFLFSIGALNENSVVDISGDTALIHYSGIRDFNAILTLLNEGRNSPFSQQINDLISGLTQNYGAAVTYDNYAIFAVQTRYGAAMIWYDTIMKKFASVDLIEGIGLIKQFSVIQTKTVRKLMLITQNNELFEWEGDTLVETAKVYFQDFLPEKDKESEHGIVKVSLKFGPIQSAGYVQATVITDGKVVDTKAVEFAASATVDGQYDTIPYPLATQSDNGFVQFDFKTGSIKGYRTGVLLSWNIDAPLIETLIETDELTTDKQSHLRDFPSIVIQPQRIAVIGDDGSITDGRVELNRKIISENYDYVLGCGDHAYQNGTANEVRDNLMAYWGALRTAGKFFAVPGNHDLDTDNGEPFFQALLQNPSRYFKVASEHVDFFMMNSGIKTNGTQIEPDNLDEATIAQSRQMRRLKRWLAESKAARRLAIVLWHHPPYTSSSSYYPGLTQFQDIPLQNWGANALICGHSHLYERLVKDAFPYFISGAGTDDRFVDLHDPMSPYSYKAVTRKLGYMELKTYPLSVVMHFKDINGEIHDEYVINK